MRLHSNSRLTKDNNPNSHFCSFFLPIDLELKLIYLGHHIKANDWIPPGGHVQMNESSIETVKREFFEELQYKLGKEKIKLFDLTVKDVSNNPMHSCKTHYDFWYLVYIKKRLFKFDKREFYKAEWLRVPEAVKRMGLPQYAEVIKKVEKIFL